MAAPISSSSSRLDMSTSREFAPTDGTSSPQICTKEVLEAQIANQLPCQKITFLLGKAVGPPHFCSLCWQTLGSHFLSISRGREGELKGNTLDNVPLVTPGSAPHGSTTFDQRFTPPWSAHPPNLLHMQSLPHCLQSSTPFPSSSAQHSKLCSALKRN